MIRQAGGPQWGHGHPDVTPQGCELYLYLESAANLIRTYDPRLTSGLLQVEAYARAVLAQRRPDVGESEIARLVELRLRSQELLCEQSSSRLWAVIGEAALRNEQVGVRTMRSQITHLINISEQPNVTLQVLLDPGPDDHVAIKEPITILRFPEEHIDDVAFLERSQGDVFLTDRKEVEHYSRLMSRLGMRAAEGDRARRLLREIFMEL